MVFRFVEFGVNFHYSNLPFVFDCVVYEIKLIFDHECSLQCWSKVIKIIIINLSKKFFILRVLIFVIIHLNLIMMDQFLPIYKWFVLYDQSYFQIIECRLIQLQPCIWYITHVRHGYNLLNHIIFIKLAPIDDMAWSKKSKLRLVVKGINQHQVQIDYVCLFV